VATRDDVDALLDAGAAAVQCGTAFLRCPESGTHPAHRAALAAPGRLPTVVTRAFTGRPARALVNRFVRDHPDAPFAYPAIHHLTRPLRVAAAERGDTDVMALWAGTGYRAAVDAPAGEVVDRLVGHRTGTGGAGR
jgi:nitronate monooxygenase